MIPVKFADKRIGMLVLPGIYFLVSQLYAVLNYPYYPTLFIDLGYWLSALRAIHLGFDVYQVNPLDFYDRPFIYSPMWLILPLEITRISAYSLGFIVITVFFGLYMWFIDKINEKKVLVLYMLFLTAPATFFAVERCNTDIIILSFILMALWCMKHRRITVALCLLLMSSLLKLYPLVAFFVFWKSQNSFKMRSRFILIAVTLVLIYWLCFPKLLALMYSNYLSEMGVRYTFGSALLLKIGLNLPSTDLIIMGFLFSCVVWLLCYYYCSHLGIQQRIVFSKKVDQQGFLIGASLFMLLYAVGFSNAYKLIWLLLCVPGLIDLINQREIHQGLYKATLVMMLVAYWACLFSSWQLAQILYFLLFVLISTVCFLIVTRSNKPMIARSRCEPLG